MAGVTLYVGEGSLVHVHPVDHDSSLASSLDHLGLRVIVFSPCSQSNLLCVIYLEDMDFPIFFVISAPEFTVAIPFLLPCT